MPDRQPVVAGRFYPADPQELRHEVVRRLPAIKGTVRPHMVMLPHAGYIFCGDIIGETLGRVTLPDTLFLLGPNHTGMGLPLAVWPEGLWHTPLGAVEVDAPLAARLMESGAGFASNTQAHSREHSLEVLLPFLQLAVPGVRVVPVAVGRPAGLAEAGAALAKCLAEARQEGTEVGIIVSSDMNHFADHGTTLKLDGLALAQFLRMDPEGLMHTVVSNKISMCGVFPAVMALYACRHLQSTHAEIVRHGTSGQVTGDMESVVGYSGAYVCG